MIRKEQLYEQILEQIDLTKETDDEELQELIRTVLDEAADEEYISLSDKIRIGRELFNSFRKLDVLQELLEDDSITEIMVNGIDHIFYEKEGRIFRFKKCFLSQERLLDVIQQIVGESNRYVNEASPIVDARLKDGSRVNVVLNPVAVNGPILTIRKFPSEAITMEQLIRIGSVTDEAANFLKKLVAAKYNIFVSGGTGAGKTTFLNALSNYIPKGERLITIEDNAELQIQGVQNLVRLEARGPNAEGEGAVTIRDLIKSALRMRPDRIVVGEVRGEETVDMISSAMLNGHSGSMSTGHAAVFLFCIGDCCCSRCLSRDKRYLWNGDCRMAECFCCSPFCGMWFFPLSPDDTGKVRMGVVKIRDLMPQKAGVSIGESLSEMSGRDNRNRNTLLQKWHGAGRTKEKQK